MARGPPMIKPSVEAGLTVLALDIFHRLNLTAGVTVVDIVRALGVARSTAYEHAGRLRTELEDIDAEPPPAANDSDLRRLRIENAVLRYRVEHPGCWSDGGRTAYSDELRAFVVELARREGVGEQFTQAQFAAAAGIPLPTFKPWWLEHRAPVSGATDAQPANGQASPVATSTPEPQEYVETAAAHPVPTTPIAPTLAAGAPGGPHTEPAATSASAQEAPAHPTAGFTLEMLRIVKEWEHWSGTFAAFVYEHLRALGIRRGKKLVSDVLHLAAVRKLMRRAPPKLPARGSTFIPPPGVQWSSDGKEVAIIVGRQRFNVAWQPMVDVGSTAKVGSAVRVTEEAAGLISSFNEGVQTTGRPPAALLLDNKACNKSAALQAALPEGTFVMHGTRGRGQSKATVEGSFGLFAQDLGPVVAVIDNTSPQSIALSVADAVTRAFSIGRNHRPRRKDGKTPCELYQQANPSPEEVAAAVNKLREIKERIEARDRRDAARRDPHTRAVLDDACARFGLAEDGDVLDSLSTLPLASIQAAVALYAAKRTAGTLPLNAGIRYLGGIARNHLHARELELFEKELVSLLEREHVSVVAHLERKAACLESLELAPRLGAIVHELLGVDAPISQVFWHRQLAAVTATVPLHLHAGLRRWLCDKVRRCFRATKLHRQQLIELLARLLPPPIAHAPGAHC